MLPDVSEAPSALVFNSCCEGTLLGHYTKIGCRNSLPTFRDNLSVPYSRVKNFGPIGCPETSVRNCHYSLRNGPEENSSHLLRGGNQK